LRQAERSGWVSDVVFDKSALRLRLKQSDKRGEIERWVKWVLKVAGEKVG
jgi:hypothetical protein